MHRMQRYRRRLLCVNEYTEAAIHSSLKTHYTSSMKQIVDRTLELLCENLMAVYIRSVVHCISLCMMMMCIIVVTMVLSINGNVCILSPPAWS